LYNPNFKPIGFERFKKEAGLNAFTLFELYIIRRMQSSKTLFRQRLHRHRQVSSMPMKLCPCFVWRQSNDERRTRTWKGHPKLCHNQWTYLPIERGKFKCCVHWARHTQLS